ncbi:MAG: outer membrane lipid asymmetry maintenance protein MlaD [Alphaproteobacteria bacterium]|nr:outer membrane lipid asymmetry maintenance protein MlaD [Alphaproteobacteria bacterium]
MKGNVLESVIGAVVLVIASLFVYFAYVSGGEKIKEGYVLTARFDDVSGLARGADIKLNGIKVGIVKSLSLDKNYQAKVELLLRDGVRIPVDSSVAISTDGIMGNKYIAISAGFSEEKLKSNEEIEFTRSAVNLEKLIDKFAVGGDKKDEK